MSVEPEIKDKSYVSIKSLFNIKYLENILSKHIDNLITANDNVLLRINAIIEKLEKKNHSRNGGDL